MMRFLLSSTAQRKNSKCCRGICHVISTTVLTVIAGFKYWFSSRDRNFCGLQSPETATQLREGATTEKWVTLSRNSSSRGYLTVMFQSHGDTKQRMKDKEEHENYGRTCRLVLDIWSPSRNDGGSIKSIAIPSFPIMFLSGRLLTSPLHVPEKRFISW
jgi:hypothetical protein